MKVVIPSTACRHKIMVFSTPPHIITFNAWMHYHHLLRCHGRKTILLYLGHLFKANGSFGTGKKLVKQLQIKWAEVKGDNKKSNHLAVVEYHNREGNNIPVYDTQSVQWMKPVWEILEE